MRSGSVLMSVAQCHLMGPWNHASWNQKTMLSWFWPLLYAPAREMALTLMGDLSSWTRKRWSYPSTLAGKSWPSWHETRGAGSAPCMKVRGPSGLDWPTQLWPRPGSGVDPNTTLSSKDWAQTAQIRMGGGTASRYQQDAAPIPGFMPGTNSRRRNLIPSLVLWHPPAWLGIHVAHTSCTYTYNNNKTLI